jgi:predicted transport protein
MKGGFKESPIKLNRGLGQLDYWNEETIRNRADSLARMALEVWPGPKLPSSVLTAYKPETATSRYTIADHPRLHTDPWRSLFAAFRKEVLALDPCVSEEFLKQYVAYKAETNFVDVEPQAKRLVLMFNMDFAEIDDPQGRCRDVTGIGHAGNGNVQTTLTSIDQLPYVMGLVRQSFERQMGGDA